MTTREKLRLAMNQQKAGIPISDPSVRLLVEKDVLEYRNAPQGKVRLSSGNPSKPASNLSAIPLKAKKKSTMVSVKELLKRGRPNGIELSDSEDIGSDSSFDSSESEDEAPQVTEPKDLEKAPTTSIEYLQAPTLPQPKPQPKPIVLQKRECGPTKFYVTVNRNEEIAAARMLLPVYGEEQVIMECLSQNDVVIICGETGSGKTTQVPQFLYEAGYGHPDSPNPGIVGITQPRRVAAVSMATRVSTELGDGAPFVSYQIRYDTTTTKDTRIKFMTDGVLLREIALDFLLNKYSVIIIDEAHERTLNTDILIGALSRIIRLRNKFVREGKSGARPLKLIVMSATLRVKDFVGNQLLFPDTTPPVLEIKSRQHPVTVHFNKRTPEYDYVGEALKKIIKIHTRLPPGGILVFLTGQNEILDLCRRLNRRFKSQDVPKIHSKIQAGVDLETEDMDHPSEQPADDDLVEDFGDSEEELEEGQEVLPMSEEAREEPLYVLPLYAMLSTKQQLKVFEEVPEGHRLCVVATNVAETSLTIPNIRYVIDSGKAKEKSYDPHTQASSFSVKWTSQASADQRKGRAGRTGPGHCYRLYSSAVFNDQFESFAQPEISRTPIEGVVLQMKSMNIDNVANFPFPSPPPALSIAKAEKHLTYLGAVNDEGLISPVGKLMAMFPVAPRYGKMMAIGQQHNCMPYVIALVAALSVGDPFLKDYQINTEEDDDKPQKRKFYEALTVSLI
ncbi:putative ATP-dependent RNA helicase DHR1 [Entomophthora muscae]|uniref:ATP-dependent RNA helicase DHR1 n=1 Tax=Entomophthora muscae TaxID=34485 RepID=A0ACC2UNK2_9FUNG|nr:putative ATP-dependent RNA helicase DHR1 [Entomophthora muscae]